MINFELEARKRTIIKNAEERKQSRIDMEYLHMDEGNTLEQANANFENFLMSKKRDPAYQELINEYWEADAAVKSISLRANNRKGEHDPIATIMAMKPYATAKALAAEKIKNLRLAEIVQEEDELLRKELEELVVEY